MDRQVLDCASPLALFNGLCPLAPEDRRSPKRWRASAIPALQVVLLLLCLEANAFPPGPYHVLYGTVRDQYGRTLSSSQAHVILQTPLGAQFSASVVPGISLPGVNYLLKVPLDAGVTPDLYQANALVPGAAYKMVVVIGTVTNVPIQMTNSLSVGSWAQSARVDLTLGTDSNRDGIPDAWESFYLASVGLNLPLSSVNANTIVPPNSYTLQQQYLLSIGAPFYDGIDLNNTNQLMADWDGDGMLNAVEYALGTDPNNPSDASAGVTPFVTQAGGSPVLELTFKQRVDAALLQIQYIPEVSSDRTNWFTDSSHVAQVGLTAFDTEFNWMTVQDLTPVTPSAPQFIRLRVCYNSIQATSPVWVGSDTTIAGANPQTHFEQIYQRAVTALNNAVVAFNDAQNVTELMRSEEDSLADFQAGVTAQELAYNNQLIELYGTPYADDMGPGKTYPQDYNGPDLLHYTYVETPDINDFNGVLPDPTVSQTFYLDTQQLTNNWSTNMYTDFNFIMESLDPSYNTSTNVVPLVIGPDGFFNKPANWTSQRASPGQIQQAISKFVGSIHALRQAASNAQGDKQSLDKAMEVFKSQMAALANSVALGNTNLLLQNQINDIQLGFNITDVWLRYGAEIASDIVGVLENATPVMVGTSVDVLATIKAVDGLPFLAVKWALLAADAAVFTGTQGAMDTRMDNINSNSIVIANDQLTTDMQNGVLSLGAQENSLQGDLVTISQDLRALSDAQAAYQALVAKGLRIQQDRLTYRQHAAALVQGFRTRDAAFRLFQNEKLQRYLTLFDLAAKYAYLAAQAYDYETGLLGTSQGQAFLNQIISAQAIGVVNNGLPQYSSSASGDPGLAAALAQMKGDWDVLKGRLGFNNPDGYGTTVSLRSGNYRILPDTNGDSAWQQVLQQARVADLRADADVMRNCLQIDDGSGVAVPGIVLTFSTTIANGLNLFGNLLAPGDHNFSPGSFATKIFSAGVCLDGYIGMDNPSTSGGISPPDPTLDPNALAATPYVYLLPVGQDSMRSPPLGDASTIRSWTVDDVAIPLPFNVSAADFSSTPFYTSANSLSEPLFAVREHQPFRPVSTTSVFNTSIYGANGALQPSQYTNKRLIGRSIWNSKWKLVIPGRTLLADPNQGLDRFIQSVKDVHLYFITYSYSGN